MCVVLASLSVIVRVHSQALDDCKGTLAKFEETLEDGIEKRAQDIIDMSIATCLEVNIIRNVNKIINNLIIW